MKRTFLMGSMLVLALPALAAAGAPAADSPSLEALRFAIFSPAAPAAPADALAPEPAPLAPDGAISKASCTVSNNCGPHSPTISCTSPSGNCSSGYDFVICDGVQKNCAPCRVSTNCSTGGGFSCTGTTIDNCEVEPHCFVVCNGVFVGSCPICP